ncbi:uncharacterized protein LOC125372067 [Haliotis rufescens]|uniref:uncharacterized protein LOC125372067 n=1 Tax=Haliotis rufescens TaxID=6454 RepID=UPI00201F7DCB|nr:uncharacterized protein LOC125372067 [Haliotis rufescens]
MGKTVDHAGTVKEDPSVRRPLDYAWPHVAMVTVEATAEKHALPALMERTVSPSVGTVLEWPVTLSVEAAHKDVKVVGMELIVKQVVPRTNLELDVTLVVCVLGTKPGTRHQEPVLLDVGLGGLETNVTVVTCLPNTYGASLVNHAVSVLLSFLVKRSQGSAQLDAKKAGLVFLAHTAQDVYHFAPTAKQEVCVIR